MDYYHSPCPDHTPSPEQTIPLVDTRSRRRGRVVLILFSAMILLAAAGLVVLHIVSPGDWALSLNGFPWSFDDSGFSASLPDDFSEGSPQNGTVTTIPRIEPVADVHLLLHPLPEQTLDFQSIYEKVIPSIVSIQAHGSSSLYSGTGVIMTEDGYVITNHHIIAGCSAASVILSDETQYEAKLAGFDAESDLAVLKIDAAGLTPAEFGSSDHLRVGDTVLALGNPLGADLFGTLTEGIVSAINRDVNVSGYNMSLIQTTAALNPGNSGGALINTAGQVVGITNMKMMSNYETIEGLGFAIPSTWTKEVVDILLAQGAITGRPTIGITCFALQPGNAIQYGRDSGMYIESVTANGPAAQAGLQHGDVILTANGQEILSLEDLTIVRDEAGVGGTLALTVWRKGQTLELTLTLVDQYELN